MSGRTYTIEEQMIINSLKAELPHVCYYCGKEINNKELVTVDHKTPLCRGGLTIKENLVIACRECNEEKDNMTEEEYYTYKHNQNIIQENFEVNKAIKELLEVQSSIIERIEQVKNEYGKVEREIDYLQKEILFDNFNACEGYLYSKKLKELLIKKNELYLAKEGYKHLHGALGNHYKQIKDISQKVSCEVYNANKLFIKRKVIEEPTVSNNIIQLKSVI